jgi:hypothetical protein
VTTASETSSSDPSSPRRRDNGYRKCAPDRTVPVSAGAAMHAPASPLNGKNPRPATRYGTNVTFSARPKSRRSDDRRPRPSPARSVLSSRFVRDRTATTAFCMDREKPGEEQPTVDGGITIDRFGHLVVAAEGHCQVQIRCDRCDRGLSSLRHADRQWIGILRWRCPEDSGALWFWEFRKLRGALIRRRMMQGHVATLGPSPQPSPCRSLVGRC